MSNNSTIFSKHKNVPYIAVGSNRRYKQSPRNLDTPQSLLMNSPAKQNNRSTLNSPANYPCQQVNTNRLMTLEPLPTYSDDSQWLKRLPQS